MERFERRPVYPRGTLSMAAGRSGYITALNTFETITSHRNLAPM